MLESHSSPLEEPRLAVAFLLFRTGSLTSYSHSLVSNYFWRLSQDTGSVQNHTEGHTFSFVLLEVAAVRFVMLSILPHKETFQSLFCEMLSAV